MKYLGRNSSRFSRLKIKTLPMLCLSFVVMVSLALTPLPALAQDEDAAGSESATTGEVVNGPSADLLSDNPLEETTLPQGLPSGMPGVTPENPATSYVELTTALAEANSDPGADTIYLGEGEITLTAAMTIASNVTFVGAGSDKTSLLVDGNFRHIASPAGQTFTIAAKDITFTGLTETFGDDIAGGGIMANNSELTLERVVLQNCFNTDVGAIYSVTTVNIKDSTLINNALKPVGMLGGGALRAGTVNLENSIFKSNYSRRAGGAVHTSSGNVSNCLFDSNTADGGGGGGLMLLGTGVVSSCTFSNNSANFGGGLTISDGTVSNCTVVGNRVYQANSGVHIYQSASLINCTLTGNISPGYCLEFDKTVEVSLLGSIIAGNFNGTGGRYDVCINDTELSTDGAVVERMTDENFIGEYFIVGTDPNGESKPSENLSLILESEQSVAGLYWDVDEYSIGKLNNNGGFSPTVMLAESGVAVDAIPSSTAWLPQYDQRGLTRPIGTAADIGAVEYTWTVLIIQDGKPILSDTLPQTADIHAFAFSAAMLCILFAGLCLIRKRSIIGE